MSRIGKNIRRLRENADMSMEELGERVGKTRSAVSQYENDKIVPRMGVIEDMAEVFGVSKMAIIGEDSLLIDGLENGGWVRVPLYGRIAAGTPITMEEVDNFALVPLEVMERHPGAFLLTVEGNSMDRILPNGVHALIEPCSEVLHDGKPYAVCVNGCDATIKRVRRLADGFELVPDSSDPTFHPKVYDNGNPADEKVTIIGEVVYHVMPYDWEY